MKNAVNAARVMVSESSALHGSDLLRRFDIGFGEFVFVVDFLVEWCRIAVLQMECAKCLYASRGDYHGEFRRERCSVSIGVYHCSHRTPLSCCVQLVHSHVNDGSFLVAVVVEYACGGLSQNDDCRCSMVFSQLD